MTNHALLAIDALEEFDIFPEHDVVIIDEAHDLVDRVTSVASDELSAAAVETAARRCGKMIDESTVARLRDAGHGAELAFADLPAGRLDVLDEALASALALGQGRRGRLRDRVPHERQERRGGARPARCAPGGAGRRRRGR